MKTHFSLIIISAFKKIILISSILIGLSLSSNVAAQDNIGDYQSNVATGNWNTASSWQVCTVAGSPGTWTTATEYPGQYSTSTYGVVTIQAGQNIIVNATANLYKIATIIVNGNLIINDNIDVYFVDTYQFIVTQGSGTITFAANKGGINLPDNATFIINNGGIAAAQSSLCYIKIGTTWSYKANPTSRFDVLMAQGGTNIIAVSINPPSACDNQSTSFTLTATPLPASPVPTMIWMDSNGQQIPGAIGTTYVTNPLSVTTTFYVQAHYPQNGKIPAYTTVPTAIVAMMGTNSWIGNQGNNNWSNYKNWTCLVVPDINKDVLIPKGKPSPHIDVTTAACHNLTINSFPGMVIDAGKSLLVDNNLKVNGSLTIQSDGGTNNGSLIVNGTSTGIVTYNRFTAHGKWFITSAPVNTVPNFDDLNKAKMLNGTSYYFNFLDEPSNHWIPFISSTFPTSLTPGQGFRTQLNSTSKDTIRFDGELNGDVTMPLSSTGNYGWNAVGNPYTSALKITEDINGFLDKNADVLEEDYNAIYLWSDVINDYQVICKSNLAGYIAWDGFGSAGGDAVQAGQGFLINVKYGLANPKVKFYKGDGTGMQVSNTSLALKKTETSWPGITLQATNSGRTRSTMVAFNSDMTTGLDPSYDAGLLTSSDFNIYTHLLEGNNETRFNIQCLPDNIYDLLEVPVGLELPQAGKVTFKAAGVILPEGLYPVLEDRLLQLSVPLKTENDSLTVEMPDATEGIGRFYLHIGGATTILGNSRLPEAINLTAYFADQKITIFGTPEQGSKAWLFDMSGRKLGGEYHLALANQNEIPASGLSSGIYLLKIVGKTTRQTLKVTILNR